MNFSITSATMTTILAKPGDIRQITSTPDEPPADMLAIDSDCIRFFEYEGEEKGSHSWNIQSISKPENWFVPSSSTVRLRD